MNKIIILLVISTVSLEAVPSGVLNEGFREVALRMHNEYREKLGLGPLELDPELNIIAHTHAEKLAAEGKPLEGSGHGYPENLWAHRGEYRPLNVNVRDAVNSWYTGSKIPGHVTYQMDPVGYLSKSVKYLGVGVGTGDTDYTVVVTEYY